MPVIRAQPGRAQHGGGQEVSKVAGGVPKIPPLTWRCRDPRPLVSGELAAEPGSPQRQGGEGHPQLGCAPPPRVKSPCRPRIPRADGTKSLTGPKALPSAPRLAARRGPAAVPAPRVPSGSPSSTQKELEKSQSLPGVGSPGRDGGACDAGAGAKAGLCAQALLPAHVPALLRPGQIPAAKMPPSFQFGLKRHLEELRFFCRQAGGDGGGGSRGKNLASLLPGLRDSLMENQRQEAGSKGWSSPVR